MDVDGTGVPAAQLILIVALAIGAPTAATPVSEPVGRVFGAAVPVEAAPPPPQAVNAARKSPKRRVAKVLMMPDSFLNVFICFVK